MSKEFVRQMALDPDHFERRRSLMGRMHLDPWLLLLLLGVMGFGLVVLFSASENSVAAVEAQLVRMGVAFVVMLFFAQLDPLLYRRWSPLLYLAGTLALLAVMFSGCSPAGRSAGWIFPVLPGFSLRS